MKTKKSPQTFFKTIFYSNFNQILLMSIGFSAIVVLLFLSQMFYFDFPMDKPFKDDGYMELLFVGEENNEYFKATQSKETIKSAKGFQTLDFEDLKALSQKAFIKSIYYVDEGYLGELSTDNEKLAIVSIPNKMADSSSFEDNFPGAKGFNEEGRLPKDGAHEAMISMPQLKKFFNLSGSSKNMIGKKVIIHQKPYTIVGISKFAYTVISYDEKENYGFQKFNGSKEVEEKRVKRLKDEGYEDTTIKNIILEFDKKKNFELLDYLNQHARSYQISSNYIRHYFQNVSYMKELGWILLLSIGGALIMSLSMISFGQKDIKKMKNLIDTKNLNPMESTEVFNGMALMYLCDLLLSGLIVLPAFLIFYSYEMVLLLFPSYLMIATLLIIILHLSMDELGRDHE